MYVLNNSLIKKVYTEGLGGQQIFDLAAKQPPRTNRRAAKLPEDLLEAAPSNTLLIKQIAGGGKILL